MLIKRQGNILYKEWIVEWVIEQKNYVKESTYANYTNIIYNHIIPKLGNYKLCELSNQILQNFLLYCFKEGRKDSKGGLSEKTVKDIAMVIKSSIRKAINYDKIVDISLKFIYPKEFSNNKIIVLRKKDQKKLQIIYLIILIIKI